LLGLKENVIVGKLIPAGTGMARYRNIQVMADGYVEDYEQPEEEFEQASKGELYLRTEGRKTRTIKV